MTTPLNGGDRRKLVTRGERTGSPTVHILCNGRWTAPGTVIYMHPYGRHTPVDIVQNFFVVSGNGYVTLIDTGLDDPVSHVDPAERERLGSGQETVALLGEIGITPDEVDVLVLTHLHHDHYANAQLFPAARIVVNRHEYEFAMSPRNRRAMPRSSFPRTVFGWLADESWDRLELVEGEVDLAPGIRLVETGGHSPGHQIVVIETAEGRAVVPGDEIYLYENLEQNIPIGYYHDFERLSAAMDLLNDLDAHVLPAHDGAVLERHPTGVIG